MAPTASKRKLVIQNLVSQLATEVDGADPYFTDLSGTDQVTSLSLTRDQRGRLPFTHFLTVVLGGESFPESELTDQAWQSELEVLVECRVKNLTDSPMSEELEDLVHDVMLAIGTDVTLGGVVENLHAEGIDEPIYTETDGTGVIRLRCEYEFRSGTTI